MTSPAPPDELRLAAEFPAATAQQWGGLVERVLAKSGQQPGDLVSTTYDGIRIAPLYTAADTAPPSGLPGLPPFVRGGRPDGAVATGWDVRTLHTDPDPAATRRAVLADLENGATSLWLRGLPVDALADVLDDVHLDLAPVTLDAGAEFAASARALLRVHDDKGIPASQVRGNLGADPLGHQARTGAPSDVDGAVALAAQVSADHPGLRALVVDALPYHQAGGSDAQELGTSLAVGVAYLRALTSTVDIDAAVGQLEFRYAATADQFLTIAKLRAARRLWARVTEVCGARPAAQLQHAVTSPAMMTTRDPWVNMLRTTVACFAAGVGGADAVTVVPFDSAIGLPDELGRRVARNTQSVLIEESRLAGVIDPAGGSWYVERLTDELARAAWSFFQDIERAGGFLAALDSGRLAQWLADTWAARRANLASGTDKLTGVTAFPDADEQPLHRRPAPPAPSGGLPTVRYEEFE